MRDAGIERYDYLIVGGGLASVAAIDGIRELDREGSIALLGEEREPPYHRPPLSKEFLQAPEIGRELLHVKPEGWLEQEARVTFLGGQRIVSLDPREKVVASASGARYQAKRILLATGGRPRTLDVPGAELEGVFTLRSVKDAEEIRSAAAAAERAVLVGAGFIGMELASSLLKLGVQSVIVEARDRAWAQALPPAISHFMRRYFEQRRVRFQFGAAVRSFEGDERVEAVVLEDGRVLPCDLVVVGIGITPNMELAEETGLAVQDGIVVDPYGETSHAYIYASGDVARFPDSTFGGYSRLEHWDHAKVHGRLVGRNMAGAREPYRHLSHFFSDVFDLKLNVLGRTAQAEQVVVRGKLGSERAVVLCGTEGRLTGAILVNATDVLEEHRELVQQGAPLEEPPGEIDEDSLTEPVAGGNA
ncbi:MAG: NAD(P)/FAD-dependent oxidoreductase [Gemmatimonadota bacterium]